MTQSAWAAVLKIAAFAVCLFPVALITLRFCIRYAQRQGTVTEY